MTTAMRLTTEDVRRCVHRVEGSTAATRGPNRKKKHVAASVAALLFVCVVEAGCKSSKNSGSERAGLSQQEGESSAVTSVTPPRALNKHSSSCGPGTSRIVADMMSSHPAISGSGRFVVFESTSALVPDDSNGFEDVYVIDRRDDALERISVSSNETEGNGDSMWADVSADGRFVVFVSVADNLVPSDKNETIDVFVRDRQRKTTEQVSVSSAGVHANKGSAWPKISADGRFVTFQSPATNLVPNDNNDVSDVFVRDRHAGTTRRVSVSSQGIEGDALSAFPTISGDGRLVAFRSAASNLVPGDRNGEKDVFVRNLVTGTTERISVSTAGTEGKAISAWSNISSDGQFVAFGSLAQLAPDDTNNQADVYLRDIKRGTTELISKSASGGGGNDASSHPVVSAGGRYIAFDSKATNLIPGETGPARWALDVFLHDRQSGVTRRICSGSSTVSISDDGRLVAFGAAADCQTPRRDNTPSLCVLDTQVLMGVHRSTRPR